MKRIQEYFFCSQRLLANIPEVQEIESFIDNVKWSADYAIQVNNVVYANQTGYNKALEVEFSGCSWERQPLLYDNPRLIGDFRKNDVFVEVQFGNSATLYRDYYKFHYGLTHGLLSLAVLIVPTNPTGFFPTRVESVRNMAEFDLANKYFKLLPIPVPILLIGLIPEN